MNDAIKRNINKHFAKLKAIRFKAAKAVAPQVGVITAGGGINYHQFLKDAAKDGLVVKQHKGYATLHKITV